MKLCHSILITVFLKQGQDLSAAVTALKSLASSDFGDEKLEVKKTFAGGFESKIIILEVQLSKEKHTKLFLESLTARLTFEDRKKLASEEDRLDEECNYYLRLDKPKLLNGIYELTSLGDCFHVKLLIAAFPKKREIALGIVQNIFK